MELLQELDEALGGLRPDAGIGSTLKHTAERLSGTGAPASDWVDTADGAPEDLHLCEKL